MHWLQFIINAERSAVSPIEDALLNLGAHSVTCEDNADEPIFEPALGETPLWQETRVTGLFDADVQTEALQQQFYKQTRTPPEACRWQILEDKDWLREWMQHFKPIQCADNFWICPSWCDTPDPKAVNLMLDPGLAFGTGTHPTTFLCLRWIASMNFAGKSVIDYGCGSGILGIAALLLNAETVTGIDIDPQALVATEENTHRNNIATERFPVYFPEKTPANKVDFVFANILAGPLVELAPTLVGLLKKGGKICLSGILDTQKQAIVDAYAPLVNIDSVEEQDGWICVVGTLLNV